MVVLQCLVLVVSGMYFLNFKSIMKIIPSALVNTLSGKIGGGVVSRNKHGMYVKAKTPQAISYSPQSVAVRSNYNKLVIAWQNLSQTVKNNWATAAATYTWTNNIGNLYHPSGYQLFIALNSNCYLSNLAIITSPSNYHAVESGVIQFEAPSIILSTFIISFPDGLPTDFSVKLYTSQLGNVSNVFDKLAVRLFHVWNPGDGDEVNIFQQWKAVLNTPPIQDQTFLLAYQFLERSTGQVSVYESANVSIDN